jgi:hypothetical protein
MYIPNDLKMKIAFLTASFFETGAMAIPTKSQNTTILDQGVPASTQWSHLSSSLLQITGHLQSY